MKKTKSFLFTASLALALAFTISCSDDEGSPSLLGACKFNDICEEIYGDSDDNKFKKKLREECEEDEEGSVVKKCPSGFVKECSRSGKSKSYDGELSSKLFYYDEKLRGMTCEEIRGP
jgi:hypothetical protein